MLCLVAAAGCGWIGHTISAVVLLMCALFQLFEAARGWCVMRAIGFRTKY